jgi:hypothetical protein
MVGSGKEVFEKTNNFFWGSLGKVLDRFLPETYPIKINKYQEHTEILDDPQLAMAMRQGTKVVHRAAENSVFTR